MKKKYKVEFLFEANPQDDCPFREWDIGLNPRNKKTIYEKQYCRIFGTRYCCKVITLCDSDYPKWCPIHAI